MRALLLVLALLAAGITFAELTELRRGAFTLTYTVCPKCPFRARFAPDGSRAYLNTSKVAPKDRPILAERLFALMKEAACAPAGATNEPNVFLRLMRAAQPRATGTTRYLTLRNDGAEPKDVQVAFGDSGLGGAVQVLDLAACADMGVFTNSFDALVPPKDARHFRLDAERLTGKENQP